MYNAKGLPQNMHAVYFSEIILKLLILHDILSRSQAL